MATRDNQKENKNIPVPTPLNTHGHIDYGGDDCEHSDTRNIPLTDEQKRHEKWLRIEEKYR